MQGIVQQICISPTKRGKMESHLQLMAIAGQGLEGDRYFKGDGSWQDHEVGNRQVTLMDTFAFKRSDMKFTDTRRNILVDLTGFDINRLINKPAFKIGDAWLRVVDYCFPCHVPGKSFPEEFHNNGGVIAEIITGGLIQVGSVFVPPWVKASS